MQQFSCVLHEQSTGHLTQHGTPSLKSYRDQISLYKKKKEMIKKSFWAIYEIVHDN